MIATLRTLTRKSKLNFGKFANDTVQDLLDRNKHVSLLAAYYKLSSINFTDDILSELKVSDEEKIPKPSVNIEMYYKVLEKYPAKYRNRELDKLKAKIKPFKKAYLQGKNHGR